jgi:hypothetical protein
VGSPLRLSAVNIKQTAREVNCFSRLCSRVVNLEEEEFETFSVNHSVVSGNVSMLDGVGVGTIINDDATISISDASAVEGSGQMRFIDQFVLRVADQIDKAAYKRSRTRLPWPFGGTTTCVGVSPTPIWPGTTPPRYL